MEGQQRPMVLLNHPGPGDYVNNPTHIAGYGTGFEGSIAVEIVQQDGTVLASGGIQQHTGGMGEVGEFYGDLQFDQMPTDEHGFIEAYPSSGRGLPEDKTLNLVRVPVVFDPSIVQGQS